MRKIIRRTFKHFNAVMIIITALTATPSFAQNEPGNLTQFTERDGLPGIQVNNILQDKYGYMWLGTINGIARYDGYEFKRFYFKNKFGAKVLICDGGMNPSLHKTLNANFYAQYKSEKENRYDILITSDKLSEGFNLNRAGVIINYDIPWNPTRVIQLVGRINRIGAKVFDDLYIYNFSPVKPVPM